MAANAARYADELAIILRAHYRPGQSLTAHEVTRDSSYGHNAPTRVCLALNELARRGVVRFKECHAVGRYARYYIYTYEGAST